MEASLSPPAPATTSSPPCASLSETLSALQTAVVARLPTTVNDSSAVKAISHAYSALHDVVTRITETGNKHYTAAAASAREAMKQLNEAAEGLRARGETTLEELPSQPVMKQALGALNASSQALTSVKDVATSRAIATSESVSTSVTTARAAVGTAVDHVLSLTSTTASSLTTRAASVAHSGATLAVRTAAGLDAQFKVQEKAVSVGKSLKVDHYAERLHVQERLAALLEKAASLDTSVTGGRGQRLLAAPWAYINTLGGEFSRARSEYETPIERPEAAATPTEVYSH